ncbi:hypothetical protein CHARACLAT_032318 [Characodon lateralis]|uniref:Uncharacterized protein n=1 Tax=Characodon lateralis TaxID=208331 RepID=A0ABU7F165_9TELE|nr:hypothetical protein [Characodon lateralis]
MQTGQQQGGAQQKKALRRFLEDLRGTGSDPKINPRTPPSTLLVPLSSPVPPASASLLPCSNTGNKNSLCNTPSSLLCHAAFRNCGKTCRRAESYEKLKKIKIHITNEINMT